MTNVVFTSYAFAATGGSSNRTTPARAADFINVKEFGAVGDGVTDDTAAFTALVNYLIASSRLHLTGWIPAGRYLITSPLPLITQPISILGAGPYQTWLVCNASFSGDLFSVSNCWGSTVSLTTYLFTGGTANLSGVAFEGFSVTGDRSSVGTQNAFCFYDINDFVRMTDIDVWFMNGRGLYSGDIIASGSTRGIIRESRFTRMRFWRCGKVGFPVVEFTSTGAAGEATNEIDIDEMSIYKAFDVGFLIQNKNLDASTGTMNLFRVNKLRIEGHGDATVAADLFKIGDTTNYGKIWDVAFSDCTFLNANTSYAAIRVTGASVVTMTPSWVIIEAQIWNATGTGDGLIVEAGRFLTFNLVRNSVTNPGRSLVVSNTTLIDSPVIVNGYGRESTWVNKTVDATAFKDVATPVNIFGQPFLTSLAMYTGTGSPETVIVAGIGSLYLNQAGGVGTTLYVKTSGTAAVGWTAK